MPARVRRPQSARPDAEALDVELMDSIAATAVQLLAWAVPVILAVTLHEVAHGWMARLWGDPTAAEAGRLSLNPLVHVDPVGTLLLPGGMLVASVLLQVPPVIFGWAKPVPVDWSLLRRPRLGIALVALAGPGANLLMLLGWAIVARLTLSFPGEWSPALIYMCQAGIIGNAVLMLLNLIPIPPLDGSRVVSALLPQGLSYAYNSIERFGVVILLVLLASGVLGRLLGPPLDWLTSGVARLFGM